MPDQNVVRDRKTEGKTMKTTNKRIHEGLAEVGAIIGCGLMATACMGALMFCMWLLANAPWTS
jgi:hypothetical protein